MGLPGPSIKMTTRDYGQQITGSCTAIVIASESIKKKKKKINFP